MIAWPKTFDLSKKKKGFTSWLAKVSIKKPRGLVFLLQLRNPPLKPLF